MTDKRIKERAEERVIEREKMGKRWVAAKFFNNEYRPEKKFPITLEQISKVFDRIEEMMDAGRDSDYMIQEIDGIISEFYSK